jgi:hypothetical protein
MTPLQITIRNASEAQDWDGFMQHVSGSTVFSRLFWLRTMAEVFERTLFLFCVESSRGIEAAIPTFFKKKGLLRYSTAPPLCLYNGFHIRDDFFGSVAREDERRAVIALIQHVERHYHLTRLLLSESFPFFDVLTHRKWSIVPQSTSIISIQEFELSDTHVSRSLRRNIKRAQEYGLFFERTNDVKTVLRLHQLSYDRHKLTPPIPIPTLETWCARLLSTGVLSVFLASDRAGKALAGRIIVDDHPRVFDWIAGAEIANQTVSASHWLVFNIINHYRERGALTFDFMGMNTPRVMDFKQRFGGVESGYYTATYYKSPFIRILENYRAKSTRRRRGIQ